MTAASTSRWLRAGLVAVFMVACTGVAALMVPTRLLADTRPAHLDLERDVPSNFAGWKRDDSIQVVDNPQADELLDRLYSQVLSRTYVNDAGQRVMLMLAYGSDQRRRSGLALHVPDVCYPAQGFEISSRRVGELKVGERALRVKRLETVQRQMRFEPLTYWTMTGDFQTLSGLQTKKVDIEYGLRGLVPDGLLFRVSSIGRDSPAEFALQQRFVVDLLAALKPGTRQQLSGLN
jgi:EpsI family protein